MRLDGLDDLIHDLRRLTHGQTTDGEAVAVDLRNLLHMPHAQILVRRALVDAEEHLLRVDRLRQGVQPIVLGLAALQPAQRPLAAGLSIVLSLIHIFPYRITGGSVRGWRYTQEPPLISSQ